MAGVGREWTGGFPGSFGSRNLAGRSAVVWLLLVAGLGFRVMKGGGRSGRYVLFGLTLPFVTGFLGAGRGGGL